VGRPREDVELRMNTNKGVKLEDMKDQIKLLAEIHLFAGENMRQTPFFSNYRPLFNFHGSKTKISGKIDLIDMDKFLPGTSGIVQVTFIKGMISYEYLKKGEHFTISEGGNFDLGEGEIVEIIHDMK
jgi:translation elongation factor EF-Tu-like GTPase